MPTLGWDYVPRSGADNPRPSAIATGLAISSGTQPFPTKGVDNPVPAGLDARRDGYADMRLENPAPLADVQHPMPGYPLSGVPGGPQPRYNPFTDGPPRAYKWTSNDKLGLSFVVAAGIAGIGVGILAVWILAVWGF